MKIDKDVYMPHQGKNQKIAAKMEIGDSVLFQNRSKSTNFLTAIKQIGFRGVSRKVNGGYRTWRIQ